MKRAIIAASAAAGVALASLCTPPAQALADDPCANITDPAAHPTCTGKFPRDDRLRRYRGNCDANPLYGPEGQLCRDFWVQKSALLPRPSVIWYPNTLR